MTGEEVKGRYRFLVQGSQAASTPVATEDSREAVVQGLLALESNLEKALVWRDTPANKKAVNIISTCLEQVRTLKHDDEQAQDTRPTF